MSKALAVIPLHYRLLAVLVLAGALAGFGWIKGAEHGEAKLDAYRDQQDAAQLRNLLRITKSHHEVVNEATRQADQARAAAAAAAAVSDRLRQRLAQLAAGHPSPSASSPPAGDPIAVLADVLGRADAAAGELAAAADAARIAGSACERAYDALTAAP